VPTRQGRYRPRRSERQGQRTPPGGLSTLRAQAEFLLVRRRTLARGGLQDRGPRWHRAGERLNLPRAGVHSQLRMLSLCGEGGLREKPLRGPLASARLRVIGLRKCLVSEAVTVSLPGADRRTGGNKIKVGGRLRGKRRSRGPAWGLRTLVCARSLPVSTAACGWRPSPPCSGRQLAAEGLTLRSHCAAGKLVDLAIGGDSGAPVPPITPAALRRRPRRSNEVAPRRAAA
jgi:hypothetical protein